MKKVTLISILGESGGVITEALDWLEKKNTKEVDNIVFYTGEERILEEMKSLKKILKLLSKERLKIMVNSKFIRMPIDDIKDERDIKKLNRFLEKKLKKLNLKNVIFNISGGRKLIVLFLLKFLEKKGKSIKWINIISYLPRERIAELGERIREKINVGVIPEKEEIEEYYFSNGNYKVFEFEI